MNPQGGGWVMTDAEAIAAGGEPPDEEIVQVTSPATGAEWIEGQAAIMLPEEPFIRVELVQTAVITHTYWELVPGTDEEAARRWVQERMAPPNLDVEIGPVLGTRLVGTWGYRITSGDWSAPESAQSASNAPPPAQPQRRQRRGTPRR